MRRFLTVFLAVMLCAVPVTAAEMPQIVIDNTRLDVPMDQLPFIEDGRTLVPLRSIFEALGASVAWEEATQKVTARKGDVQIELTVDSSTAYINGRAVTLDKPAKVINGRTFVPLRFVGEAFGATVSWLADSDTVAIITRPRPVPSDPFAAIPVSGEVQKVSLAPGEPIVPTSDAIFFLNVKTGAVDGWTVAGAAPDVVGYTASADGRFVIARSKDTGWVVDRTTGIVQKWDRYQHDLVTAGGGRLLFQEVRAIPGATANGFSALEGRWDGHLAGLGLYTVVTPDLKPVATFTLPVGNGRLTAGAQALFSPAGEQLMISRDDRSYLVDVSSGKVSEFAGATERFQPVKGGAEAVAVHAHPRGHTVRRYNWQGEPQAEAMIEARWIQVSDDGEWVAWEVVRDQFTPVVYYARLNEAHNPFQALGATMCHGMGGRTGARWMNTEAEGNLLLIRTKDGLKALTTDGSVRELGAMEGETHDYQTPAPGTEGLLAFRDWQWDPEHSHEKVGVVGMAGDVAASVTVNHRDGLQLDRRNSFWGAMPDELRFTIRQHRGSGGPCGDYSIPLSLKVDRPGTFDWNLTLQVKNTGSCLNVRSGPSRSSEPVACLKDGARIVLGNNAAWDTLPSHYHNDGGQWFKIRLESGAGGWIDVASGYVGFAE